MSERRYKLQKGDQVVMHTCMEHDHPDNFGKIWTCRSDEFQHKGHDYGSIFLEGFSGSFSTEFLQKVDVTALVDSLQQQVAQLQEMSKLHTSGAKQLVQDLHTLRVDRDELRKALEESRDAIVDALSVADMEKRDMTLESWASLADQKNRIVRALGRE
ncbi:hypothetical protein GMA19_03061 [Paenibacillus polymyxa E681]|uniref:hypothetical protein n=1 Tax=Paenibacillus polymyxa TaxID=1406 RepID=UPI0001E31CC1|nr:hypothetical protein [Paenibacillus polymyxa]ADM70867.1 hypothetical protein PPE_03044 [Paenibacillus polymyxa E681]QNV57890.1 hypothetical protein GE561_03061 [Paenibacillus polymyxa E681]QNV62727.1 hypothetical protein GMA19_03061 [Paenibacillus polymyxa E681]